MTTKAVHDHKQARSMRANRGDPRHLTKIAYEARRNNEKSLKHLLLLFFFSPVLYSPCDRFDLFEKLKILETKIYL